MLNCSILSDYRKYAILVLTTYRIILINNMTKRTEYSVTLYGHYNYICRPLGIKYLYLPLDFEPHLIDSSIIIGK